MKKVFLSAALALAVAGSWAFYPKAAEPSGYMMVVSSFIANGFSYKIIISVINPDGQVQMQEFSGKTGTSSEKIVASTNQLHECELKKLNELRAAGWYVTTFSGNTFVLAKQ